MIGFILRIVKLAQLISEARTKGKKAIGRAINTGVEKTIKVWTAGLAQD